MLEILRIHIHRCIENITEYLQDCKYTKYTKQFSDSIKYVWGQKYQYSKQ